MAGDTYTGLYNELDSTVDAVMKKHHDPRKAAKRAAVGAAALALVAGGAIAGLAGRGEQPAYVPGEFLVEFDDAVSVRYDAEGDAVTGLSDVDRLNEILAGESYDQLVQPSAEHELDNWYRVDVDDSLDLESWMERFENADGVESVTFNGIMAVNDGVPNDPYFRTSGSWGQDYEDLWGLRRSGILDAWEVTTGNADLVFAVVDTGIANDHPDIASRMWRNPNEVAGNGLDDDGNGYIDDVFGVNTIDGSGNSYDGNGHGTHVGGTIGAATNNGIGVAGINQLGSLMAVKVLSDSGSGSWQSVAQGIVYAADNGADVINMSLGGPSRGGRTVVDDAIDYAVAHDVIIVVAAGNSNQDAMSFTPANNPHVITVAAIEPDGNRTDFSNWGPKIDVGAPGRGILSTVPARNGIPTSRYHCLKAEDGKNYYCELAGTSMASPHVAGEVGLILAANPDLMGDVEAVRAVIRAGVDPYPRDQDRPIGPGHINFGRAVREAQDR